jgi:hypothetical protein
MAGEIFRPPELTEKGIELSPAMQPRSATKDFGGLIAKVCAEMPRADSTAGAYATRQNEAQDRHGTRPCRTPIDSAARHRGGRIMKRRAPSHGPSGGVADSLDEAKAAFRAAGERGP